MDHVCSGLHTRIESDVVSVITTPFDRNVLVVVVVVVVVQMYVCAAAGVAQITTVDAPRISALA
jgi:hypothetical protein